MSRFIIASCLTGAVACIIACGGGGSSSSKPSTTGDKVDAIVTAQNYVEKHLRYPHDAEFPMFDTDAHYNSERQMWVVKGLVKAKNALGAQLTIPYTVTLFLTSRNTWHVRFLNIDGEVLIADLDTPTQGESAAGTAQQAQSTPVSAPQQSQGNLPAERAGGDRNNDSAGGYPPVVDNPALSDPPKQESQQAVEDAPEPPPETTASHTEPDAAASKVELPTQQDREELASRKVTAAKNLGKKPLARKMLQDVIDEYPQTEAAKEAAELIKLIPENRD